MVGYRAYASKVWHSLQAGRRTAWTTKATVVPLQEVLVGGTVVGLVAATAWIGLRVSRPGAKHGDLRLNMLNCCRTAKMVFIQ